MDWAYSHASVIVSAQKLADEGWKTQHLPLGHSVPAPLGQRSRQKLAPQKLLQHRRALRPPPGATQLFPPPRQGAHTPVSVWQNSLATQSKSVRHGIGIGLGVGGTGLATQRPPLHDPPAHAVPSGFFPLHVPCLRFLHGALLPGRGILSLSAQESNRAAE